MLDYRIRRIGRRWVAWLSRPGNPRPLRWEGATKREAMVRLLNAAVRMAAKEPGRLLGKDWLAMDVERAAQRLAAERAAVEGELERMDQN
jgi:hypothetical protein